MTRFGSIAKMKFRDPALLPVIGAYAAFVATWSYVGIAKYYSLTASVYDLGISMQSAYFLAGHDVSLSSLLHFLMARNGLAIFMIPVALTASYPLMIVIQSLVVGAAVFPIYGIAQLGGYRKHQSAIIGVSYLIFFPLSGLLWFDFHYQMFFVFLFLLAYYLSKKRMWKLSALMFVLSGLSRYPFMVFPFLFSIIIVIEIAYTGFLRHGRIAKEELNFSILLMGVSVVFLVGGYIASGNIANIPLHTGTSRNPILDFDTKMLTLLLLFAPLLFAPLLSHRAMILSMPFFYLLFTANSGAYTYPALFHGQYTSGIVPFLFVGLIEGLPRVHKLLNAVRLLFRKLLEHTHRLVIPKNGRSRMPERHRHARMPDTKAVLGVLCILAVSAIFMQPYGPLNYTTSNNFHIGAYTDVNMSVFNSLKSVLSLIPSNEPHVLIQNNIVEALPGPIGQIMLVPQYNVGPNITYGDVANNSFPTLEGTVTGVTPIDYAVADINDQNTLLQFGTSHFPNMLGLSKMLLSSHYYGVRAEENGVILIQRGYFGPIAFAPFYGYYPAMQFQSHGGTYTSGIFQLTDIRAGTIMWQGPNNNPFVQYLSLLPGIYSATFNIAGNSTSQNNVIYLAVTTDQGRIVLNSTIVHPNEITGSVSPTTIVVNFYVNNMISGLALVISSGGWNGTVSFFGAQVRQIATIPNSAVGGVTGMIGITPPVGTLAIANSTLNSFLPQNAIDSNLNTAWISSTNEARLTLYFPTSEEIEGVCMALGSVPSSFFNITVKPFSYGLEGVYQNTSFITGGNSGFTIIVIAFPATYCKKLELLCQSAVSLIRINEITLIPVVPSPI